MSDSSRDMPTASDEDLHAGLNDQQLRAVQATDGAYFVVAGAGTGKTKTLTHRVAELLRRGVPPKRILLLAFTNQAAEEFRSRIEAMVGDRAEQIAMGTFHSVLLRRVIKGFKESATLARVGLDGEVAILDEKEAGDLMRAAIRQGLPPDLIDKKDANEIPNGKIKKIIELARARGYGFQFMLEAQRVRSGASGVAHAIERLKKSKDWAAMTDLAMAHSPGRGRAEAPDGGRTGAGARRGSRMEDVGPGMLLADIVGHVWIAYEGLKRQMSGIDFDDILVLAESMMRQEPEVASQVGDLFTHVMVDEFQDTNPVQMKVLDWIVKKNRNLCCVGDGKQAIYGFRESDAEKTSAQLRENFPELQILNLQKTYRCPEEVCDMANALCEVEDLTPGMATAPLVSVKGKRGRRPVLVRFLSEEQEARAVSESIRKSLASGEANEVVVIYRKRSIKVELERALMDLNLRYTIAGDRGFFERSEVRNAIALLRMAMTPWDSSACKRVLKAATIGVSWDAVLREMDRDRQATAMQCLARFAEQRKKSGVRKGETAPLTKAASKLSPLIGLCDQIREHAFAIDAKNEVMQVLMEIWRCYFHRGMEADVRKSDSENPQALLAEKIDRVNRIFDMFLTEIEKGTDPIEAVEDLFALSKGPSDSIGDEPIRIRLSTIHGIKGEEAPKVYLLGMEQQTMLSQNPTEKEKGEAGRLAYVGITRSAASLVMTCCEQRTENGQREQKTLYEPIAAMVQKNLVTEVDMTRKTLHRRKDNAKGKSPERDNAAA